MIHSATNADVSEKERRLGRPSSLRTAVDDFIHHVVSDGVLDSATGMRWPPRRIRVQDGGDGSGSDVGWIVGYDCKDGDEAFVVVRGHYSSDVALVSPGLERVTVETLLTLGSHASTLDIIRSFCIGDRANRCEGTANPQ